MPGVLLQIGKALRESLKSRRCVLSVKWGGGYQGLRFNVPLLQCPAPSVPPVSMVSSWWHPRLMSGQQLLRPWVMLSAINTEIRAIVGFCSETNMVLK